jgi:hypothetical protein
LETPNLTCSHCGKPFYRKASYAKRFNKMFCCRDCYTAALGQGMKRARGDHLKKNGQDLNCVICGKLFYRSAFWIERGVNKTCGSFECKSAYFSGSANPYWNRITSAKTRAKLDANRVVRHRNIFTRQQRKRWRSTECAWCGATEKLTLDHIIPVFEGGKPVKTNAQTLCASCNKWKFHHVDVPRFAAGQH